ncbi:hypothetical protein CKO15_11755 [Halorhodospira abdelmalekii]|uniref:hypothetical protein n=1 Tax=Halorhodospira abdelmalekii TaxID=421629 RepID=UPI0019055593|nr:hypothetical protein [Halorhodospira abdelmalekii]MBK1735940.1 hypothetical protein [Halorhodospira abdelmalekii]
MKGYLFFLALPLLGLVGWWTGLLTVSPESAPPPHAESFELPDGIRDAELTPRAPTPEIELAAFRAPPDAYPPPVVADADDDAAEAEPIPTAAERLVLSGIMSIDERRLARLGGRIVSAGDRVQEYRVTQIMHDHVVVHGPLGREEVHFLDRPLTDPEPTRASRDERSERTERTERTRSENGDDLRRGLEQLRELQELQGELELLMEGPTGPANRATGDCGDATWSGVSWGETAWGEAARCEMAWGKTAWAAWHTHYSSLNNKSG